MEIKTIGKAVAATSNWTPKLVKFRCNIGNIDAMPRYAMLCYAVLCYWNALLWPLFYETRKIFCDPINLRHVMSTKENSAFDSNENRRGIDKRINKRAITVKWDKRRRRAGKKLEKRLNYSKRFRKKREKE